MKFLIVNADDFGQTPEISEGIIECHRKGIVTSTTVITNYDDFENTLKLIKKHKSLKYGLHLNLTDGKALSGKSSLTDINGNFYPLSNFIIRLTFGLIKQKDLKNEIEIQIKKLVKSKVAVSHADSHRHIHCHPFLSKIYFKILKKYGINKVRIPLEKITTHYKHFKFNGAYIVRLIISSLCLHTKMIANRMNLKHNDKFTGMLLLGTNKHQKMIKNIFNKLEDNKVTEILVHPGYNSKYLEKICEKYNKEREIEINSLTSAETKKTIEDQNIKLISYADIK